MRLLPPSVRLVYFDAVGTLLRPDPSVAATYQRIGQRYGCNRPVEDLRRAFSHAFLAEESWDAVNGYRTDEQRERQRWRAIVSAVLPEATDPDACFAELWDHFARPEHWQLEPGTLQVLAHLAGLGLQLGLASNFDERLIGLVQAMPELRDYLDIVLVSSQVGWRKPAREFYASLCGDFSPHEVLMVGDDRVNDYEGARAAGLHAVLLDETTTLSHLLRF
ncbi:MAG: HAD-IA family hydrolase [Gemmataceae bacterium]